MITLEFETREKFVAALETFTLAARDCAHGSPGRAYWEKVAHTMHVRSDDGKRVAPKPVKAVQTVKVKETTAEAQAKGEAIARADTEQSEKIKRAIARKLPARRLATVKPVEAPTVTPFEPVAVVVPDTELVAAPELMARIKEMAETGHNPIAKPWWLGENLPGNPSTKQMREWAKAHNITCAPQGRIPAHVSEEYRKFALDRVVSV